MHCAPNLPAVRTRLQQGPHDRAAASSGLGDFAVFPAEVVDMVLTCLDSSGRKAMHLVCQRLRWALMRQHIQELGYLGAMLHAVDKLLPHVQPAAGNLIQHPLLPHPPQQAALDPAVQQEVAAAVPAAQPAANQAPPVAAPEAQQGELAQLQPAAYAAQQEPPDPPADGEPLPSDAEDDDDGPPPLLPWNQFQAAEEPSLKVVVKAEVQQGSRHTELQHVQGSEVQRKYTEDMLLRCMLQEPQLTQQWQIMEQKLEAACQQFTQRTRLQMQQQLQLEEQQRMQQHSDCAEDERKDASASDCDDNAAAAEAATVPAEQTWTLMDYLPGVHRVYSHPMSNQVTNLSVQVLLVVRPCARFKVLLEMLELQYPGYCGVGWSGVVTASLCRVTML